LARERPDVVLMQQTRHLLNQPQLYPDIPCVVDADDADYLDPRHHERIAAAAAAAAAVVGGNRFVAGCLGRHNPHHHVIWTCTPPTPPPPVPPAARRPILAWAHASPLGYPVESKLVAAIVQQLAAATQFEFWLFGTNEAEAAGYLAPLRAAGAVCRALPPMDYDEYLRTTGACAVGLQPVCVENEFSRGKSFGKLLAYLAGQVAVVASAAVDHALFFRGDNGCVVDDRVESWVAAIRPLLADPAHRERVALAGHRDFCQRLTTDVHARLLDPILRAAIARGAPAAKA
jgi:glycosyltransferase involved in cell wall biosynthesis